MKTPKPDIDPADVDAYVVALRGDLPSSGDEARVRARLLAAGVLVTGTALSTSASAATGSGLSSASAAGNAAGQALVGGATTSAGAPLAVAKAGLVSKLLLLPAAAKVGAAATLAVAAATSLPFVLEPEQPTIAVMAAPVDVPASPAAAARPPADLPAAPPSGDTGVTSAARPSAASTPVAKSGAASRTPGADERLALAAPRARAAARTVSPERPARAPERGATPSPAAERGRTQPAQASALSEEAGLIERAMLALGAGNTALARQYLEEHARRFPDGSLERERQRALTRVERAAAP